MDRNVIVEMRNIRKEFPGVVALDHVNFTLKKGTIHGLLGENGAGKSTLMKILSGTYPDYAGEVRMNGKQVHFKTERDALDAGISIVAQELHPIMELTVAENIYLGNEPKKLGCFIDFKKRRELVKQQLEEFELSFKEDDKMKNLTVAKWQMVEIVKAMTRNSQVIIMDEPTSALTDAETMVLFERIKQLRDSGIAIIYISHKLEEIYKLCDEVTVLCDGKLVGTDSIDKFDMPTLISMMVGRTVDEIYPPINFPKEDSQEILQVKGLRPQAVFEDITFSLKKGEILGFAGMMGAGRSEVMRTIFGLDRYDAGEVILEGQKMMIHSPREAIVNGMGMVTEDRMVYGFVGGRSIKDNIMLPNFDKYAPFLFIKDKKAKEASEHICREINVKSSGINTQVRNLSGGNQQKVVLAKWLVRNMKVLILDEPTRGIDVGAKQEIYSLIKKLAEENGLGIILISSELPEVIAMSHRIYAMEGGRIVGEFSQKEVTANKIMEVIIKKGEAV